MLLKRKLQNVLMINSSVFVGLLLMVSNCLAQNGTWTQKADIPTARLFASSCELDGKIYVIGGAQTLNSSLSTMEVYDPATDTWDVTKADMPTARAELCVAAVNGKIYAFGGTESFNGTTIFGVVEEYDPLTDTWDTNKQPMPNPRKGATCGVINNKIYVAGGALNPNPIGANKLEVYDPATDTWTQKAFMLAARYYPQCAVLSDTLYVIGGLSGSPWTGKKTVQKYDPITDSWESGTNMIYGRVGHTTNVINGIIYAIGGDTQPPVVEEVEEYNPQTMSWEVIDTIPSVMICHTSSVYNNEIYLFSGSKTNVHQPTLTDTVYSYIPPLGTSIESQKNLKPDVLVLHQNYPNPFNSSTTIHYTIPKQSDVTLKIFDMIGRELSTLINKKQKQGNYKVEFDAKELKGGFYFYRLEAGAFVDTKKMFIR